MKPLKFIITKIIINELNVLFLLTNVENNEIIGIWNIMSAYVEMNFLKIYNYNSNAIHIIIVI